MDPMNERGETGSDKQVTTIVAAILIFVSALVIARAFQSQPQPKADQPSAEEAEDERSAQEVQEETPAHLIVDFETPEQFSDKKEAEFVMNSTQGKPTAGLGAEQIVTGIVTDESEENVRYFATSSYDPIKKENFVGIYRYNTVSNRWWRIYKATYKQDEDGDTRLIRVLGKEGRNLILAFDAIKREPEACESLWLVGDLVLLNMDDAYAGFKEYALQKEIQTAEEMKRSECLASDDE